MRSVVFAKASLILLLTTLLCALTVGPAAAQAPVLPSCVAYQLNYFAIYPSPAYNEDHTLFADVIEPEGRGHQLLKSADRGLSWRPVFDPDGDGVISDLAFSPSYERDQRLLLATWDAILVSSDAGETWSTVKTLDVGSFPEVEMAADGTLFLAIGSVLPWFPLEQQGVFRSTDGGATWTQLYQGSRVLSLAVSPDYARDRLILIAPGGYHYNMGVWRSDDGGETWQASNTGLALAGDPMSYIRFSPNYVSDQTVFVLHDGILNSGLFKSTDQGHNWTLLKTGDNPEIGTATEYVISPRYGRDSALWARGSHGNGVSTDGGATWRGLPFPPRLMAADAYCLEEGRCGVELFGVTWDATNDYLYRSFDGGQTWQCLEDPALPPPPRAWLPLGWGANGQLTITR